MSGLDLYIQLLAGFGDGVAELDGKNIYFPFTCPGDIVNIYNLRNKDQQLLVKNFKIKEFSKNRIKPECQHFTICGGCRLQHLPKADYIKFKEDILRKILAELNCNNSILEPLVFIGNKSRRRVDLKVSKLKNKIIVGFNQLSSHDIFDLKECPVVEPKIVELISILRDVLQKMKKPGRISSIAITLLTADSMDLIIKVKSELTKQDRVLFYEFCQDNNITRLIERFISENYNINYHDFIIYDNGNNRVDFSGIMVDVPVGAFLQASSAGESSIVSKLQEYFSDCNNVADLYSGCGTYSFSLLQKNKRFSAFEGCSEMVAAMHNAVIKNNLDGIMNVEGRDLYHNPLAASELNYFDGIIINPPRNGALPQVKNICQSNVAKVAMVSCNPFTFKRDAKYMLDNGYDIVSIVPIDQFYWSNHIELVVYFLKK